MAFGTTNLQGSPQAVGATFFNKTIENSLRMSDANNSTLQWSAGTPTSTSIWTMSLWIKFWDPGAGQGETEFFSAGSSGSAYSFMALSTRKFVFPTELPGNRNKSYNFTFGDPASWYHVVVVADLNQSEKSHRVKLYVNGTFNDDTYQDNITQTTWSFVNASGITQNWGGKTGVANANPGADVYLADINFCDGYAYGPEYFGEDKNGVWVPKEPNVTYGNNGYRLEFKQTGTGGASATTVGADTSGRGNHFTDSGIESIDITPDTPTNNWCILNALKTNEGLSIAQVFEAGALDFGSSQGSPNNPAVTSTFAVSSGKWYWEVYIRAQGNTVNSVGIAQNPNDLEDDTSALYLKTTAYSYQASGSKRNNADVSYGDSWTAADIIGVALDLDNGAVYFYKNGTIQNSGTAAYTGLSGEFTSYSLVYNNGGQVYNFGQDASFAGNLTGGNVGTAVGGGGTWKYAPPSGYKALKASNLPEPVFSPRNEPIENSYFYTTTYEGNGGGQRVGQFLPLNEVKTVNNAIRFEDGNSAHLSRTPGSAGNRDVNTTSFWVKRGNLGTTQRIFAAGTSFASNHDNSTIIEFRTDNTLRFQTESSASVVARLSTNKVFKDTSSWYHIVLTYESTNSTSTDRIKLYVNGVRETDFSATTYPSSGVDNFFASDSVHYIGRSTAGYLDGYLADFHFVDGQALDPSYFGQTDTSTEKWIPKTFTGNHGQNGFHLEFLNNVVGADSANTNSFTPVNLTTANTVIDTPTKSYCTLDANRNGVGTLSEGNLKLVTASNNKAVYSNFTIPDRGKWYWEMDNTSYPTGGGVYIGLAPEDSINPNAFGYGDGEIIFTNYNGTGYVQSTTQIAATWCNSPSADTFVVSGDVLQFAYNADDGEMFIGNNGTWYRAGASRSTFANATKLFQTSFFPKPFKIILTRGGSVAETYQFNFGQELADFSGQSMTYYPDADGYFAYPPPTGYKALNTDNYPQRSQGVARRKTPVFSWIKNRDATDSNMLFDKLRGPEKVAHSDTNAVETTEPNTLQKFLPGGAQIGSDDQVNTLNESYVIWNWCMHDNVTEDVPTGSGFSNGRRLVDKRVGLSIVTYTASAGTGTIDHGLGQTPDMIIATDRGHDTNWFVWHKDLANASAGTHILNLDTTGAEFNPSINHINDTAPTATAFAFGGYMGAHSDTSSGGQTKMLLSFKSIPGYSKFGKFTGNANADGPFVHCDFAPAFVMIKSLGSGNWNIIDSRRAPTSLTVDSTGTQQNYNGEFGRPRLYMDDTTAEEYANTMQGQMDLLSNGFKLRSDHSSGNTDGGTIIFMAFAETPFKYTNAI